jgi:DNA-binding NarL/FixJ family response regulator
MAAEGPASRLRVALADDHDGIRTLLREMLTLLPDLEVVGEARNGLEAVRLSEATDPDVVLLDVQMPLLDGIAAAELIRSFRPQTRIVLHSAAVEPEARERARAAGMQLLDKTQLADVLAEVVAPAAEPLAPELDRAIESLVVTALQKAQGDGVVVVRADGTIPFYNARAAEDLGLPYPARETNLAQLRDAYAVHGIGGTPLPPELRPIAIALREGRPVEMAVEVDRGGVTVRLETNALPFFDERGDVLGAAHYFRRGVTGAPSRPVGGSATEGGYTRRGGSGTTSPG